VLMAASGSEDEYVQRADDFAPFDVIVVDGIHRPACLNHAPSMLSPAGIIILDDAQRAEYLLSREQLTTKGFRAIEFWGPQPVSKHEGCTTVFYRPGNALLI
jgi:predicted O-methyltransferase YrrM